jgi:hypothetical protein
MWLESVPQHKVLPAKKKKKDDDDDNNNNNNNVKENVISVINNRGKWNHLRSIHTVPEQHTSRARNKGNTETAIFGTTQLLRKVLT